MSRIVFIIVTKSVANPVITKKVLFLNLSEKLIIAKDKDTIPTISERTSAL